MLKGIYLPISLLLITGSGVNRRTGSSFSNDVIERLLQTLVESGPIGKTRLSGKAGVNYETCIKYVNFLVMLNLVKIVEGVDRTEHVSVTSEGIEHLRKLDSASNRRGSGTKNDTNILPQIFKGKADDGSSTQSKIVYPHIPKSKQKNIVIVDDDESSLMTYELFLEDCSSCNFKLKTFSRPEQALRFLIDHPDSYDLVVLDIRMPIMSGFRVFQGLKAANPNAKVIFMTSLDIGPELLDIFPDIKPNQFIRKPLHQNEFIKIISEAVS